MRLFSAHWLLPKWESKYLSYGQEKNSVYFNKKKKNYPEPILLEELEYIDFKALKSLMNLPTHKHPNYQILFLFFPFCIQKGKECPWDTYSKIWDPPPH